MGYLFGDSTPFPLKENFLETLLPLTDTIVAILKVDDVQRQAESRIQQLKNETDGDKQQLLDLGRAVAATIKSQMEKVDSLMVLRESEQLIQSCQRVIEQAQQNLVLKRENTLNDMEFNITNQKNAIEPLLADFFINYQLPNSIWGMSWKADAVNNNAVTAKALSLSPAAIETLYRLNIPASNPWSRSVKVGDLMPEVCIHLLRKSTFGKKLKTHKVPLSKFLITAVDLSPERQVLTIRQKPGDKARTFEIFRTISTNDLTIQTIDKSGSPEPPLHLNSQDTEQVQRLLQAVDQGLRPLIGMRVELTALSLKETPLAELDNLGQLAHALINSVASIVRELILRSPNHEELCLKRELGDRRREELFLPTRELTERIRTLSKHQRTYFDAFGLLPKEETTATTVKEKKQQPADEFARKAPVLALIS